MNKVLYFDFQIEKRVKALSQEIKEQYNLGVNRSAEPLIVVCILKGAVPFCMDLIQNMGTDKIRLEFLNINAYDGKREFDKNFNIQMIDSNTQESFKDAVEGKKVLIVDDIYDSGQTIHYTKSCLKALGAADIKSCVLLYKKFKQDPERAVPDFYGMELTEDYWVHGYGLDLDEYCRNHKNIFRSD